MSDAQFAQVSVPGVFTPEHDVYVLTWEEGPDGLRPVVTPKGDTK